LDHGLIHKLRDLREAQLPLETGGILMGYHDFNLNLLVVVDACAAPVDSDATPTTFKRGIAGVKEIIDSAAVRTAGIVQYIGEWHSHPPKVSTAPSKDDQIQLLSLATLLADDGLPALSLSVGEGPELTAMLGVLA
jgi:integrative and conjugative element protein (TIGR02256 family)